MKYVLGIDAGATRTVAGIANETGKILAQGNSSPGTFSIENREKFKINVKEALDDAIKNSKVKIDKFAAVYFGGAEIDTEETKKEVHAILLKIISVENSNKLLVGNDTQLVRPSCSEKEFGIAVICGTGSNFYGTNKKGQEAHVGGLGAILADKGSAYWIGHHALRHSVQSDDGREPNSLLKELIFKHFLIKSAIELLSVLRKNNFAKDEIAGVAKIVDEAYRRGDNVSTGILERAVRDIILSINTLTRRLNMEEDEFDIVAVGGVFKSYFPFREKISEKLIAKNAKFIICDKEPVIGAINLALAIL